MEPSYVLLYVLSMKSHLRDIQNNAIDIGGKFGRSGGGRTHDQRLKRPLLYH